MAVFLSWKNQTVNSKERFITNLFGRVSPRWYPVNIIGSTVYSVFDAYATQLFSSSADLNWVMRDTFLSDCRTGNFPGNEYSKLYENFGVLYEIPKMYSQNFDTFNTGSSLVGYRNQIRLLSDAYFGGSSIESFQRVGQSYTGVSPYVQEFVKSYGGWQLTCLSGSVLKEGPDFYVIDKSIPEIGNIVQKNILEVDLSSYVYTLTKLGVNTKIYSKKHVYGGLLTTIYNSGSIDFSGAIQNALHGVVRADQYVLLSYSSNYAGWRPGNFPEAFPTSSIGQSIQLYQDYLQNVGVNVLTEITGSAFSLPVNYNTHDWQYDWVVRTYNDAYYEMYVRSYPLENIPDTVYFTQTNSQTPIEYFPIYSISHEPFVETGSAQFDVIQDDGYADFMTLTAASCIHYIANSEDRIDDVSGWGSTLFRDMSYGTASVYKRGRHENQLVPFKVPGADMQFTGSATSLKGFSTPFYFEFWACGIDNTFTSSAYLQYKIQSTLTDIYGKGTINSKGWCAYIDSAQFAFKLSTTGSPAFCSLNISDYLDEEPSRWHLFAGTYSSGVIYLYVDGEKLAEAVVGNIDINFAASGSTSFSISGPCQAGVDEFVIQQGFLSPDMAMEHFELTKPRMSSTSIMFSGSVPQYHQPKIVMHTQGSREIEWHEFSVKAIPEV